MVQVVAAFHGVGNGSHVSLQQVVEVALFQDVFAQVLRSGSGDVDPHVIEVVKVCLQVLFGEVMWNVAQVVKKGFPINATVFRQGEQRGHLRIQLQESDVVERQAAIGHYRLKLHTERFHFRADFHQVASPIQGSLGRAEHHPGHRPYLWHDFGTHQVVNPPVVLVLRLVAPDSQFRQSFAVEEFGRKNSSGGDFGGIVPFQYGFHLLIVVGFSHRFRPIGGDHGGHRFLVVVYTHVLRPCWKDKGAG